MALMDLCTIKFDELCQSMKKIIYPSLKPTAECSISTAVLL